MKTITIDPITRLEGHGKITILLDDAGEVERAALQVPELRGFEAFVVGRLAEDLPQITSRICGICPTAHHMASVKALDDLYQVAPPPAARAIRELVYSAFMVEDHALHFYYLAAPDFVPGADAPAATRNILGLVAVVGKETARRLIDMRRRLRELVAFAGGKATHPVLGLPGGVARPIPESERPKIREVARDAVVFAQETLEVFHQVVLGNRATLDLVRSDGFSLATYYLGQVDAQNRVSFYDGALRVVGPDGAEHARFAPRDYTAHLADHVEPWTYVTFPYLKQPGWHGFTDGPASGVVRVAPLARLNASAGLATPLAQAEHDRLYETLGPKPVHHTLANHWARLVELLHAAERLTELAEVPELTDSEVRNLALQTPHEGVGVVEAPRGTLIHHYRTDERGVVTGCRLVVATQHNAAALSLSIERAARALIHGGVVTDGLLDRVEMAFRAYDPCLSCATHALPGESPISVEVYDACGALLHRLERR
jgi:F420-non-reducing hydrogenase large subunit